LVDDIVASLVSLCYITFFFNETATSVIYALSLHDALPICTCWTPRARPGSPPRACGPSIRPAREIASTACSPPACSRAVRPAKRSEEHTSELQSRSDLVCRLLLEKKKKRGSAAQATRPTPP